MNDKLVIMTLGQYHMVAIPEPDGTTAVTNPERVQRVWGFQVSETGGWVDTGIPPGGDDWQDSSVPGSFGT